MAVDGTKIQWTDATWSPTTGCDRVSAGCQNCYALALAKRLKAMGQPAYQNDGDPRTSGPGFGLTEHPDRLDQPFSWRKPRRVFVNSMSDLFHPRVSDEFIAEVFAVMAATPQHTYQILTKRPARMRSLMNAPAFFATMDDIYRQGEQSLFSAPWPLPGVWLGVSVEDQQRADERIPPLLDTPAAIRFLSCEPLLGPIDLRLEDCWLEHDHYLARERIGWVIVGGESGQGARPMHPAWARDLRDQCLAAGVPLFVKQFGAWRPLRNGEYPPPGPTITVPSGRPGRDATLVRHGGHNGDPDGWPEDLRIRQWPDAVEVPA